MSTNQSHLFFLRLAGCFGMLAVVLGAFGAHALKTILTSADLAIYETSIRYQFYHTFAMLVVGILLYLKPSSLLRTSGYSFAIGILLFSGSLIALSFRNVCVVNMNWLGPITPLGGLFFILGWLLLVISIKNLKTIN